MATQRTKKTTGKGRREADRRKTILRAAIDVFSKKGYLGCRIADVAREAGVAYGLVYHYFRDKDELLESVFKSGWTEFLGRLEGAITGEKTLEQRIEGMVHVAFQAYREDHRTVKVLILEVGRSPSGGAVNRGTEFARVLHLASAIFIEAQQKGEISEKLDPRLCAAMLFGSIEMGLTAFVLGILDRKDDAAIEAATRQVSQTFLRGVMGAKDDKLVEVPEWLKAKSAPTSRLASRS